MSATLSVGPLENPEDLERLCTLESWAFGLSPEQVLRWLESSGLESIRVARRGRDVVAGLLTVPMGQFFGGRSVPAVGLAGVAVAPELRGRGVASALLRDTLRELAGYGTCLSVLYPSTWPLYRRVGYEPAGGRFAIRVRPTEIGVRADPAEPPLRPLEPSDHDRLRELYHACAQRRAGYLDRGAYVWDRVLRHRGNPIPGYVVEGDAGVEGYVVLREVEGKSGSYELHVSDLAASTAGAGRRLFAFLAGHRTLSEGIVWHAGPADPLLTLLPERAFTMSLTDHWMLRVLDVSAALAGRGYPRAVRARLELAVHDSLLPQNGGRFVLALEDGKAGVERGGRGRFELDVRGLAALYSGFLSPAALVEVGLASGDPTSLEAAAALFSGPTPAMPDHF